MSVRVERVVDGDSLVVRETGLFSQPMRVRLYGIDAPEAQQKFGLASHAALGHLVNRRGELLMEVFAYDRYARAIGLLYWRDHGRGRSINLSLVRQGYAYCLRHARGEYGLRALGFLAAEQDARRERLGSGLGRKTGRVPGCTERNRSGRNGGHAGVRKWGALPLRLGWSW